MINTKNTDIKYIKFNVADDIPNILSFSNPDTFSYDRDNFGSYRLFMTIENPKYKSLYLPIGHYLIKIGSIFISISEDDFSSL